MTTYVALLRKDPTSHYGVDFPDFPGCVTAGRTLDEARHLAKEALDLHLAGMMEDKKTLPVPTSLDAIMDDPANRQAVAFLVDIPATPGRSVRVNVMLPEDLVGAIDRVTRNRSRFLADAAKAKLRQDA